MGEGKQCFSLVIYGFCGNNAPYLVILEFYFSFNSFRYLSLLSFRIMLILKVLLVLHSSKYEEITFPREFIFVTGLETRYVTGRRGWPYRGSGDGNRKIVQTFYTL